jgi:hypothetical protein
MSRGRKPDPNQYALVEGGDPIEFARKAEEKNLVRSIPHERVVAWCVAHGIIPPSETEFRNAVEVFTYLIHCEGPRGIFPSIEKIRKSAFPKVVSVRTAERALEVLKRLGWLSAVPRGRSGNEYIKHSNMVRQMAIFSPPERQINRPELADHDGENGGLTIRGYNPEPTKNQPTTTTSDNSGEASGKAEWAVVVEEVCAAGVNQAQTAVDAARARGAAPDDVRAIVAFSRDHRDGWRHADVVLYRRLLRFEPGEPACGGWPAFDDAYQAKVDRDQRAQRDAERGVEILRHRREMQESRERAAAGWQGGPSFVQLIREMGYDNLARGVEQAQKRNGRRANLWPDGGVRFVTTLRAAAGDQQNAEGAAP